MIEGIVAKVVDRRTLRILSITKVKVPGFGEAKRKLKKSYMVHIGNNFKNLPKEGQKVICKPIRKVSKRKNLLLVKVDDNFIY